MSAFSRAKYRKSPVFFPVSNEFRQRRVSARLRAPPSILNCREIPARFSLEIRERCPFSRLFLGKPDRREWTARHQMQSRLLVFSGRQLRSPVSNRDLGESNGVHTSG